MKTAAGCAGLLLFLLSPSAYAKTSTAERFDAVVRVQPGGALDVMETMVLRFESGTFTEYVRELAARRTDGIEVRELWMDGRRMGTGDLPGQASVDGTSRIRIRWRFPPASSITRTFAVRYLVRGAVRQDAQGDLLVWRVPGGQHAWRIESSTIEYELPAGVTAQPALERHRTDTATAAATPLGVRVEGRRLRSHGWIETALAMPSGSILTEPPAWQQARLRQASRSAAWLGAGVFVFMAGLIVLFAIRQRYDAPSVDRPATAPARSFPDALPPALVGALLGRGGASLEHAAATLIGLAERGAIHVKEGPPGTFGVRTYLLTRAQVRHPLARHEEAAVDAAFSGGPEAVTLAKARGRLVRRFRRFSHALGADLEAAGLVDPDRRAVRRRYARAATAMFLVAATTFMAWPLIMSTYGPWPLLIPAALSCAAIVALILYATSTPLSNEGVRRAHAWRGFKDHLKSMATQADGLSAEPATTLPYAIALGLAGEWSKHLKNHPAAAPSWFSASGDPAAYAKFIADAGAGAQGHSPHGV